MANFLNSFLFTAKVYKWEVPGDKRGVDPINGTTYLLNTNSITNLIDKPDLTYGDSSMYYFDNPFDSRDNSHYMVTDHTAAQLRAHINSAETVHSVTLAVYPTNDPTESTENTVVKVDDIAFARAVPDSYSATQSYVWVRDNRAFKVKRLRCLTTLAAIITQVA
jgi:hypothetical protein